MSYGYFPNKSFHFILIIIGEFIIFVYTLLLALMFNYITDVRYAGHLIGVIYNTVLSKLVCR